MRWYVAVWLVAAGCYDPTPVAGAPCNAQGECPTGLVCAGGVCVRSAGDDGGLPDDSGTDGASNDAASTSWGTPVALVPLNTASTESDPSLTDDGLELYFTSNRPNGVGATDIYVARRTSVGAAFTAPVLDAELSTAANDYGPEISPDGLVIHFTSNRDGDFQIYRSTRADRDDAWSVPAAVVTDLSSADDDVNVALSPDGQIAIVDRETDAADRELFLYTQSGGSWGSVTHLTSVGSTSIDGGPTLDANGLVLIFHSDRGNAASNYDLYVATRTSTSGDFGAPVRIDELSTSMSDGNPFLSANGRRIVFARTISGTNRDLYEATR